MTETSTTTTEIKHSDAKLVPLYIIDSGKMTLIHVQSELHKPTADELEADKKFGVAAGETEEERKKNDALIVAISSTFRGAEEHLKNLASGAEKSVLFHQDAEVEELLKKNPKDLYMSRVRLALDPEGTVLPDQWRPIELYNLRRKDVAKLYTEKMVADFEAMKPTLTHVRLLLIESCAQSDDITALVRFIVHFVRRDHHLNNMKEAAVPEHECKGKQCECETLKKDIAPQAPPDHSIHIINVAWGFQLVETRNTKLSQKANEEVGMAKLKRLNQAHEKFVARRLVVREQALRARAPVVLDFTMRHFGMDLLRRLEQAEPNLPDRYLVRVTVENSGTVVNLDETYGVTHRDVKKFLAEDHAELKKTLADRDKKKQAGENEESVSLHAEALHISARIQDLQQMEKALAQCDPANDIVIMLYEPGRWIDEGVGVQAMFKSKVPYSLFQSMKPEIEAALKREKEVLATAAPAPPPTNVDPELEMVTRVAEAFAKPGEKVF